MKTKIFFALSMPLLLLPSYGCFKSRAEIAQEREQKEVQSNLQENIVEYRETIDRLQSDLGKLQGRIEELEHQRKKEMSSLNSSREGTEKNVGDLKGRLEDMQKNQAALFDEIKQLKEENIQLLKAAAEKPRAPVAAAPSGKKNSNASTGTSFEGALSSYKAKDYDSAIEGFRGYLEAHPRGKKNFDARYLLGEALYRKKQFAEAIVEFSVPQEKVPKTALGRKSALRIAESFKAMGKNKDARAFAQVLIDGSPDSDEAKAARKLLK